MDAETDALMTTHPKMTSSIIFIDQVDDELEMDVLPHHQLPNIVQNQDFTLKL